MDEKREAKRPVQLSLTLILLLVALAASLLAVWKLRQDARPIRLVDGLSQGDYQLIEPGMTHHDVARIMGERRSGDGGVWVYRIERDETRREFVVAKVVFEDDRVKSVITSREPYPIEYQIPP